MKNLYPFPLLNLPDEILLQVFKKLDLSVRQFLRLRLVCQTFDRLLNDGILEKNRYGKTFRTCIEIVSRAKELTGDTSVFRMDRIRSLVSFLNQDFSTIPIVFGMRSIYRLLTEELSWLNEISIQKLNTLLIQNLASKAIIERDIDFFTKLQTFDSTISAENFVEHYQLDQLDCMQYSQAQLNTAYRAAVDICLIKDSSENRFNCIVLQTLKADINSLAGKWYSKALDIKEAAEAKSRNVNISFRGTQTFQMFIDGQSVSEEEFKLFFHIR